MRKHEIPRESKGEGRILYFFTGRSMITTLIGMAFGLILGAVLNTVGPKWLMFIPIVLFGVIGFMIGTIKIPEIKSIPITKSVSGLYVDEMVLKYIKFKKRRSLKVLEKEE